MKISVLTLFPTMFSGVFDASILKRAKEKEKITIEYIDIRDFGLGSHKIVDDKPYGGGVGMVMRVDVLDKAIQSARCTSECKELVILLDPQGEVFNQALAKKLSTFNHIIFVCGHYEGVDERIRNLVNMEISIGDYILTGGEIPTMVIVDAIVRLIPGVLGKKIAIENESFTRDGILEHAHYTRPAIHNNNDVPSVLLSGNHAEIEKWRKKQALLRTKKRRPELLKK